MTTAANPASLSNGNHDPFVGSPAYAHRYASLDIDQFTSYSTNSPTQAKRALEAHLKDTDRRIQDASRLGTTLLQQRKDLSARLQEVEEVQQDNEVPEDLRKRLAELEKEYNEVGKESARAFLPKSKVGNTAGETPSALTGSGRESPTKGVTAPSRRQRNQPTNRVHDIEFATEISTSLLAQVRQLQAALSERDEELKDTTASKAQLESDAVGMMQRIKHLDDNEQRYKDENWNLETRLQELEASHKEATEREQRVNQSLKSTQSEKASAQRDLDDLKVSHEKLNEEHSAVKRQHETDLHGLRRDATSYETEKGILQKKIADLTAQNTELAKAVSYRMNQPSVATDTEFASANEEQERSDGTPDESAPESPVKGTPRHGMLESETLKSSLNHAHRMIQNLKNNIHREKTEKIELKRMLQDARDELETRRSESSGVSANVGKKRRSDLDNSKFKKPARPLGANRGSTTEIVDDEPDWEDHDGTSTPSKSWSMPGAFGGAFAGVAGAAALGYAATGEDTETTDAAFETATERGATSDAFETGRESAVGDESEELTETESNVQRGGTIRKTASGLAGVRPYNRQSFQSTASLSDEEVEGIQTPVQGGQQPKYRLRLHRGSRRDRVGDLMMRDSPNSYQSPASSTGTPQPPGQSLGDELDALDDGSVDGTPSRFTDSAAATPETQRMVSVEPESPVLGSHVQPVFGTPSFGAEEGSANVVSREPAIKAAYADAGVMTDPWEPEPVVQTSSLQERAAEVVGGALAGFGLGSLAGHAKEEPTHEASADLDRSADMERKKVPEVKEPESPAFSHSAIVSQESTPVSPPRPTLAKRTTAIPPPIQTEALRKRDTLDFSPVVEQHVQPLEPATPLLPHRSSRRLNVAYTSVGTGSDEAEQSADESSSTLDTAVGAGVLGGVAAATGAVAGAAIGSRAVLGEIHPNAAPRDNANSNERDSVGLMPLMMKKPMTDEGSQTVVSGDDIENMLRNKTRVTNVTVFDANGTPQRPGIAIGPNGTSRSFDATSNEAEQLKTPRRPASAGSMRNKSTTDTPPPLPDNHTQRIAAAQKVPGAATAGTMGPPLMPASAYKQKAPKTPLETGRMLSRDGTTPRARPLQSPAHTQTSRRTSISSFASEVDERLNGQTPFMYPEGVQPPTDPRMIQAITQTMIGEYLWKYTRKAGRSDTSNSRHRRFFWVHPYTRTLYWSEKDPSTAGRDMLKAKSVAIDAVRVISDDNAYPPGLHRKSLVVLTPGREIVFTAPTGQRHETWFNALSYLLLRTDAERAEAEDEINQDDIDEFRGGFGSSIRRSISRMTGRSQSRVSLSSYNSRTTRNSSPQRGQRDAAPGLRGMPPPSPSPVPNETATSRTSTVRNSNNGRFSSITSKFRAGDAQRASYNTVHGRGSNTITRGRQPGNDIYDASVAAESAEDLRAVIEKQEKDADRLENVRACCDGKHDVGSLSRASRHSSLGNRFSAHTHSHAHPRAEPILESR